MTINYDMSDVIERLDELMFMADDEDEELAGKDCPRCGYPIVVEHGLELCYHCGWSEDSEDEVDFCL